MMRYRLKNSIFLPFYFNIRKAQKHFVSMLKELELCKDIHEKLAKAEQIAYYAAYHPSGYYSSEVLEQVYLDAAKMLPDVVCKPEPNTVLHIMSSAYPSGGHTRVVERWIDHSKKEEKHSVVVIAQDNETIPEWIKVAPKNHGGEFIEFEEMDILARAEKLRKLGAKYERIVLHTHMHDGTAIIAFGTELFTTPIILFNHADHVFWLGISIADIVADIQYGSFSTKRRNATKSCFLGIPPSVTSDIIESSKTKRQLRDELGIPQDDFVVISTGTAYKFNSMQSISFAHEAYKIAQSGIRVYVIGPNNWDNLHQKTDGKVTVLGPIYDKERYYSYLQASDLYVGSFPFASYTAMMDAVECGLPFVQLVIGKQKSENSGIDKNKDQSLCWVNSMTRLHEVINLVRTDASFAQQLYQCAKKWMDDYGNVNAWRNRLGELYEQCPKKHYVHLFHNEIGKSVIIDDTLAFCSMQLCYQSIRLKSVLFRKIAYYWIKWMIS